MLKMEVPSSSEANITISEAARFPGFRFSPTDEELISCYLKRKIDGSCSNIQIIPEIDICRFEPWELPARSVIESEKEWFFFSPRGRKYPNGSQSRRATEIGYWKATGKERTVKSGSVVIGTKRTLVFHIGRAPKGERTEWIMHEYCLNENPKDFAVCRLRKNPEFRISDSPMHRIRDHVNNEEGCSKNWSSSYDSPSQRIDSASECDRVECSGEFSGRDKDDGQEDCYAEILNDDIINLDEYTCDKFVDTDANVDLTQMERTRSQPFQGTASRRVKFVPYNRVRIKQCRPGNADVVEARHGRVACCDIGGWWGKYRRARSIIRLLGKWLLYLAVVVLVLFCFMLYSAGV